MKKARVLSAKEIMLLRISSKKAQSIIKNLKISEGMAEKDVARILRKEAKEQGLGLAFRPIVATGRTSSTPHSTPTSRKIREFVMIDFGVRYKGYCSDITETIFFDKQSGKYRLYCKLKKAFGMVLKSLGKCITGDDVHMSYIKAFRRLGLPKMPHSIGHGVGLKVHVRPKLKKGSKDLIRGTVIAIEPAIYFKGKYGLRFERDIFVNKSGKAEVI